MTDIIGFAQNITQCPNCGAVIGYTKPDLDRAGGDRLQCQACHGLTNVVTRRPTVDETYRAGHLVTRIER